MIHQPLTQLTNSNRLRKRSLRCYVLYGNCSETIFSNNIMQLSFVASALFAQSVSENVEVIKAWYSCFFNVGTIIAN